MGKFKFNLFESARFHDVELSKVFSQMLSVAYDKKCGMNSKGFEFIEHQAQAGNPDAFFVLGLCYENGLCGLKRNIEKAKKEFQLAISGLSREAALEMYSILISESVEKQNHANQYLIVSAIMGNHNAIALVADQIDRWRDTQDDFSLGEALRMDLEKLEIKYGEYPWKDQEALYEHLKAAFKFDNIKYQSKYFSNDQVLSLLKEDREDHSEINELNRDLFGRSKAKSQLALAKLFELGQHGHEWANYLLGFVHQYGHRLVEKDGNKSKHYYFKAASQLVKEAFLQIGGLMEYDDVSTLEDVFCYYLVSAILGYRTALDAVAYCMENGVGCPQNRFLAKTIRKFKAKLDLL